MFQFTPQALRDPPACPQGGDEDSEDCLRLSVFVPREPRGPRPVVVFFPGGMNVVGSATSYGPLETLAARLGATLVVVLVQRFDTEPYSDFSAK